MRPLDLGTSTSGVPGVDFGDADLVKTLWFPCEGLVVRAAYWSLPVSTIPKEQE